MRGTGVRQNFVSVTCLVFASCRRDREFKKLRRQLQRKLHFKIELCVRLSVTLYKWAWRTFVGLARMVFMERQKVKDLLLRGRIVGRTWNLIKCTKKRAARAARLFFLIQPIKSLVCGADVAVAARHFLISLMTTFFHHPTLGMMWMLCHLLLFSLTWRVYLECEETVVHRRGKAKD